MTTNTRSALPSKETIEANWRRIGALVKTQGAHSSADLSALVDPVREARVLVARARGLLAARFPDETRATVLDRFFTQVEDAVCSELHVTRATFLPDRGRATESTLEPVTLHDALAVLEEVCEAFIIAEEFSRGA